MSSMTDGLSFEIEKEVLRLDQLLDQWLKGAISSGYLETGEQSQLERDFADTVLTMKETLRHIKEAETLMVKRRIYSEAAMEEAAGIEADEAAGESEAQRRREEEDMFEREQEYKKEHEHGYR